MIFTSIVIGLMVGIFMRIPFFKGTSFQDVGIYYDMWIILAIFIIFNAKSLKEAIAKCFVFFLITQPLIYFSELLIDVVLYHKEFNSLFKLYFYNYYIKNNWLLLTFLTIPGSAIAYQVKKQNILSSLILCIATSFLAYRGISSFINLIMYGFPKHLLNSLLCLFFAYSLVFTLLDSKKNRLIGLLIVSVTLVVSAIFTIHSISTPAYISTFIENEDNIRFVNYDLDNYDVASISIEDEGYYVSVMSGNKIGNATLTLYDEDNNKYEFEIILSSRDLIINKK